MQLVINGRERDLAGLSPGATIADLLTLLDFKTDRVAVEHNGEIITRAAWPATSLSPGDRFEIVHFVGGGVQL
jgi:thiamine biosynthesis protein ThiS